VLKWPNDLLLGGRKLAGILAQSGVDHRPGHTDARFVVVGIGLNVGWAPPRAASLGEDIDPREVLSALLCAYDALPVDIVECYRARLDTIGRAVRIELPDGTTVEGRATDVQADGRLVVLDDCGVTHRYDTGDIVHLR
jgi:BirA family biotin operon repressor/biotin-[acetyl-CoA-carboxylase] ligase